ncbi:YfhO family protein [Enterococcus ureilyticus]|uniref:YfhO family protein n=1 Tax=Enterococcus ureilyticus TaxID=1131292 RepID=UPI001A93495B|nr:YfhO family protein [Enterococcus ureilyticus]MBO0445123.1 YfhO family protein [Enterococcus ureilyticus]
MSLFTSQLNQRTKKYYSIAMYGLFLFLSIFTIYFMLIQNQKIFIGDDLSFHLGRIEGLYLAISNGDYFPKINYFLLEGMGYISSLFYPDFLIYPAAVLKVIGLSTAQAYVVYIIMLNFLTFVIAYHSFYSIKSSRKKAFLFALLYGLSSYRLSDVLYRAALGEILAFMVLPIAFVGIIKIVFGDYKQFYILTIGMMLLFFSHMITAFIFCIFILVFLILNVKKLIKEKQRMLYLIVAAICTILLVALSLFPMLEQLQFQKLVLQDSPMFYLEKTAEPLLKYIDTAWKNQGFNNLGLFIFILLIVLTISAKKLDYLNKQLVGMSVFFFIMATTLFPNRLLNKSILNMIQFPWRYFIIVTFSVCWVAADTLKELIPKKIKSDKWLIPVSLCLLLINTFYYQKNMETDLIGKNRMKEYSFFSELDAYQLGYGQEYLPSGFKYMMNAHSLIILPEETKVDNMKRTYNVMTLDFKAKERTKLIFPIVYYKGYKVNVEGSGTVSEIQKCQEPYGFSEVFVEGNGRLTFWYEGTTIQRVSFYISLTTAVLLIGYIWAQRKKRNAEEIVKLEDNND